MERQWTLDDFIRQLLAFGEICRLDINWKTSIGMIVDMNLPEELRFHRNRFCHHAKSTIAGCRECLNNDYKMISSKLRQTPQSFLNKCHAGVWELIVPFFDRERIVGILQCGPFLHESATAEEREALKEWNLPEVTEKRLEALKRIIPPIFSEIAAAVYPIVPEDTFPVRDERLWELQEYIESNYARRINVAELAKHCFLSESRLIHLFKRECGVSLNTYLKKVRLREAKKFLRGTNWSLAEIAMQCGFCNQSYFSRIFREETGENPLTYRKKEREDSSWHPL